MTEKTQQGALAEWAATVVGRPGVELVRRPGGGSHQAWDVVGEGGRWFLRADASPPPDHVHYTLRREAEVYRAVRRIGLPTAEVLGIHPSLEAVLLERVDGEAAFAPLDADAQTAIIDDFTPWLATLHAADPSTLDLPALGDVATIAEGTRRELDIWEARLDASGAIDPVLTACFGWLREHVPETGDERPSLVQGDTGPGNFLHDGATVTAFLDFELAHLGDPMTDLAWVGTRNTQEPVPDFDRFLRRYAEAADREIDVDRIRYHMLFAELRIAVLGAGRRERRRPPVPTEVLEIEWGNALTYGTLHRRLTVEALAAAAGVPMPAVAPVELADTDDTLYFDAVLHQMRHQVGPAIDDPWSSRLMKGMARTVKYLRQVDRAGRRHEQAELDDLGALLGSRPESIDAGSAALHERVRAGELTALDLLPYAAGQVARRTQLLADAMGRLATSHLPVLPR
jgi:aminoglycoside phosphotransferase (APT) family kinase protein